MFRSLANGIETVAGLFLAFVTALTFTSVILRYVFSAPIPDSFDISRLLIGVVVFWGIAVAGYRNEHIQMDVLWSALGDKGKFAIDLFSTLCALGAMAVFARMLGNKVVAPLTTTSLPGSDL